METAKAARTVPKLRNEAEKYKKVRKGARQSYEQTVFDCPNVFFTPSQKFDGKFSIKEDLTAVSTHWGDPSALERRRGANTSMFKRCVKPDTS